MTVEQALLAALAPSPDHGADPTDVAPDDNGRLLSLIEKHRLGPYLYHKLPGDCAVAYALAESAANSTSQNLALCAALAGVVDAFAGQSIPVLPFKGPLLAEKLHGNLAARNCYDIDLLVPEKQLHAAVDLLGSLGYQPEDIPTPRHRKLWYRYRYEQAFAQTESGQRVELHWRVMPSFFPFGLSVEQLIARAHEQTWEKRRILELPDELLMILLCAHGTRHHWAELQWVADIAALINNGQVDWQRCSDNARELGALRMLQFGILLATQIPGVQAPEGVATPAPLDSLCKSVIDQWWSTDQPCATNRKYRFYSACRERTGDRLRMWWRLLFQPTQADFEWLDLPTPLGWVYPLIRPLRLITSRR